MNRIAKCLALVAALSAVGAVQQRANAADQQTVKASSAWISQGRYFQTGENEALFIGALVGTLYVETAKGRLDTVELICPGDFEIDLKTGEQEGEGKCIITDKDGENVFAEWTCEGQNFLGCEGKFKLIAGTGKFQGITGGSKLKARTTFSEIVVNLNSGAVVESSAGLLTLPELTYKLP